MHADCDIVFALTADVRRNSRALRQIRALLEGGLSVQVLTLGPAAETHSMLPGARLRVIPTPEWRGPLFFLSMHRRFSQEVRSVAARLYHASDLYVLPAMNKAANQHGGALTFDSRELYTRLSAAEGKPWVRAFWRAVEGRHIRQVDRTFTVNHSIANRLAEMYRIKRPIVVPNVPTFDAVSPSGTLRARAGLENTRPIVLYQGFLRKGRGCELLVSIAPQLPNANIVFVGNGDLRESLISQTVRLGVDDRVRFVDLIPPDELLPVTADADVGICLLEGASENHRLALPNKLFEYLAAGVPVLGSDHPEIARVIRTYDVGQAVRTQEPQQVLTTLRAMLADQSARRAWSRNTRLVFQDEFNPQRIRETFLEGIQSALSDP